MFCKATLLTVALALMASATPIAPKKGIAVPIQKRTSLKNSDGTFNADKALIESVKTAKCVSTPLSPHPWR